MFVDFNILNQLGSPSINSNTFANRPAAGQIGRLFVSTDTFEIYRDTGTTWDLIGGPGSSTITGTGTATQIAYFTGAQTIASSANLFWDNTTGSLGINTSTPGAELDIHGTGIIVQVNATGTTSNAYLAFQRTGTGVWRIGDTYNGGSNFFELHNTILTIDALEFEAATNKSTFLAQQTYASGLATGNQFTYNLTVPNGVNITSPNAVHAVNSYLNLSLGGNTTIPAGTRQGLEGNSRISFTGAGTLTMTQGSTVRAFSALSSVYSFNGSAIGTITHLAGLRICFPDNIGSAINITNNYGLLLNDQTAGLGTVTYTNRWGIYQEGPSDINYFNGNLLVKTTTNAGFAADINGTARVQNNVTVTKAGNNFITLDANANLSAPYIQLFFASSYDCRLSPRATATIHSFATGNVLAITDNNLTTLAGLLGNNLIATNQLSFLSNASAGLILSSSSGFSSFVRFRESTIADRGVTGYANNSGIYQIRVNGATDMTTGTLSASFFSSGNVGVRVATDAGFVLDVGGNTRVQGSFQASTTLSGTTLTLNGGGGSKLIGSGNLGSGFGYGEFTNTNGSGFFGVESGVAGSLSTGTLTWAAVFGTRTNFTTQFVTNNTVRATIFTTGNMAIGTTTDTATALLSLSSTTKGFLPPVMTGAQAEAIGTPAEGLMVYANNGNGVTITSKGWWGYDGATWVKLN